MAGWISFISGILASKKGRSFLSGRFNDPDRPKERLTGSQQIELELPLKRICAEIMLTIFN
jgi:hypothetical protein